MKQLVKNSVYNEIRKKYPQLTDTQFGELKKKVDADIRERFEKNLKEILREELKELTEATEKK